MQPRTQGATARHRLDLPVRRNMLRDHLYEVMLGQRAYLTYQQAPGGVTRRAEDGEIKLLSSALAATVWFAAGKSTWFASDDGALEHLQRELWEAARQMGVVVNVAQRQRLVSEWCDGVAHVAGLIMSEEERMLRGSVD